MTLSPLDIINELEVLDRILMRLIQENENVTRKDITDLVGLSRTKVTQHIQSLFSIGILDEVHELASSGGRRAGILELNPHFCYLCGISLGATSVHINIADFQGKILKCVVEPISASTEPDIIFSHILNIVNNILEELSISPTKLCSFGIGVPAPINSKTGRIDSPAIMIGWEDFSIHDYILQQFPKVLIRVENDVDIMAIGEQVAGLGKNHENFIVIKIATGIGCGIICQGKLYAGFAGYSGHIGHVSIDPDGPVCYCGNTGCLEKLTAGPAMVEMALSAVQRGESPILKTAFEKNNGFITTEDIGNAATHGDKVANEIIIQSGTKIGQVLATIVSFFNPELIIIGGGVSLIGPQLLTSIQRTVINYSLPISTRNLGIRLSELGSEARQVGTVQLALRQLLPHE